METIITGLSTSVIGMIIVFAVLIIISLMLNLLKYGATDEKPAVAATATIAKPAVLPKEPEPTQELNKEELIAVITAAVAAGLNTSADKLVVRSLRKVSPWIEAARREQ